MGSLKQKGSVLPFPTLGDTQIKDFYGVDSKVIQFPLFNFNDTLKSTILV